MAESPCQAEIATTNSSGLWGMGRVCEGDSMETPETDEARLQRLRREKRAKRSLKRLQRVAAAIQAASQDGAGVGRDRSRGDEADEEESGGRKSA